MVRSYPTAIKQVEIIYETFLRVKGADFVAPNLIILLFMAIGLLFLVAALLQYLWNTTMPQVFNLKEIDYWQAFRLLLIAAILFGGPNIAMG